MKPRDLLKKYLISEVAPTVEHLGFKYSASQLHFSRRYQNARQVISFSLSKWNAEDNCTFWTIWSATSKSFADWHKKQWGEIPANNALGGDLDCNIPYWERGQDHYFHLHNNEADQNEIERLIRNILQVGVPFLQSVSTWEGAAEHYLRSKLLYHRAADFLFIAGKYEQARAVLIEGLEQYERLGRIDNFGDLPMIKARLARYL